MKNKSNTLRLVGWLGILCLGISVGIGVVAVYRCLLPGWLVNARARAHQEAAVANGMRALHHCLDDVSFMNPRAFASAIGPGIHTNVLNLPPVLLTNFDYTSNDISHLFLDQWQRPYVVAITPLPGPTTNILWFDVRVWSCGANGLDDDMNGDDLGGELYAEQPRLKVDMPLP